MKCVLISISNLRCLMIILVGAAWLLFQACSEGSSHSLPATNIPLPPSLAQDTDPKIPRYLELSEQQVKKLDVQTIRVQKQNLRYPVSASGIILPAPDQIAIVSAPIDGLVTAIYTQEGRPVHKGDVILELESLEFANLVSDYLKAKSETNYQKQQLDRKLLLYQQKINSQNDLEKIQADYRRARVALRAAYSRLLAVGVSTPQIRYWEKRKYPRPRLKILASIDGIITEHLIGMGQAVSAYQKLGEIVNLDKVLVKGFLAPEDALQVKVGDRMAVLLRSFPEKTLETQLHSIIPKLDPKNSSITVNAFLETPAHWPYPGQHVQLKIFTETLVPVLSVPLAAVGYQGKKATVFVKKESSIYEKRFIDIHKITGQEAIITAGLQDGEEIAVSQIFDLKTLGNSTRLLVE